MPLILVFQKKKTLLAIYYFRSYVGNPKITTIKQKKKNISTMNRIYLTPDKTGYLAPRSVELPMETEQCIAMSDPSGYGDGGDMGDDFND